MIAGLGPAWRSRAVQCLLGPDRSALAPAVLWVGWLDEAGDLVAMSGTSVPASAFVAAGDGVTNAAALDCGAAGAGWTIAGVGLFDAASGGELVVSAAHADPVSPAQGASLGYAAGALTFTAS